MCVSKSTGQQGRGGGGGNVSKHEKAKQGEVFCAEGAVRVKAQRPGQPVPGGCYGHRRDTSVLGALCPLQPRPCRPQPPGSSSAQSWAFETSREPSVTRNCARVDRGQDGVAKIWKISTKPCSPTSEKPDGLASTWTHSCRVSWAAAEQRLPLSRRRSHFLPAEASDNKVLPSQSFIPCLGFPIGKRLPSLMYGWP